MRAKAPTKKQGGSPAALARQDKQYLLHKEVIEGMSRPYSWRDTDGKEITHATLRVPTEGMRNALFAHEAARDANKAAAEAEIRAHLDPSTTEAAKRSRAAARRATKAAHDATKADAAEQHDEARGFANVASHAKIEAQRENSSVRPQGDRGLSDNQAEAERLWELREDAKARIQVASLAAASSPAWVLLEDKTPQWPSKVGDMRSTIRTGNTCGVSWADEEAEKALRAAREAKTTASSRKAVNTLKHERNETTKHAEKVEKVAAWFLAATTVTELETLFPLWEAAREVEKVAADRKNDIVAAERALGLGC